MPAIQMTEEIEVHCLKLSREEVIHIGLLARLGLSEEDIEKLRDQLSNILENFEALKQVNTENTIPTSHSVLLQNVMREDTVTPSLPQDDVLVNAPSEEDSCFRVKPILGEQ